MTVIRHIRMSYATLLLLLGICSIFGLGFIMYKVLPKIYEAGPTAWLVSYALILAVVFALFVLGIFLGYFYGSPKGRWLSSKKTRRQFREALSHFGLGLENRLQSRVSLLSGGQRQTLTLLMATLSRPKVLLLDEHTAALDPATAFKIIQITEYFFSFLINRLG